MDIRERVLEHPASFMAGWAAWIPLAIWIVALVHWIVSGEIEVVFGLAGIVAGLLLGFVAIIPPTPAFSFIALALITGTVVGYPTARGIFAKRQLKAIDLESLERAYHSVSLRPDNIAAKFKIARLVFEMGYPGHALRIAEGCLGAAPQAFFQEEHRLVAHWRKMPLRPQAFDPLNCIECGQANVAGNIKCAACGAPYLLHRAQGKVLPGDLGKRLLIAWMAMVGALAGTALMFKVDGPLRVFGIVGFLCAAFVVLIIAMLRPGNRQSA
jgi:hypothetical protein